jgi:membrane associated rhomboid family serine protease
MSGYSAKQTSRAAMMQPLKFIRSTIPIPVLFASIGVPVFGLTDLLTGNLLSRFIQDVAQAAWASAVLGSVLGYLVGWYVVRKTGLRWTATAYDVDAAVDAKKRPEER